LLRRLEETQRQARQVCDERECKVQTEGPDGFPAPPTEEQVAALAAWLRKLESVVGEGREVSARVGLGKWTTQARKGLAEAEAARDASAAPLRARRELRGLLEALQAKAHSCGRAEDARLAALAREADQLLRRRPTPLARAQEVVAAYEARLI